MSDWAFTTSSKTLIGGELSAGFQHRAYGFQAALRDENNDVAALCPHRHRYAMRVPPGMSDRAALTCAQIELIRLAGPR